MRALTIVLLTALIYLLFVGGFYYLKEDSVEEVIEREVVFNENFIKNNAVNIYCPVLLKDGFFSTEDLSLYCDNESLPEESFTLSVLEIDISDDYAFVALSSALKELPRRFDIVVINREGEQVASHTLTEEPHLLEWKDNFLTVSFSEKEEKYRLIGDRLEDVVEESTLYGSPQHGFFLRIPNNWKIEKEANFFLFYHPKSIHTYPIVLKIEKKEAGDFSLERDGTFYNIYTAKNTPYKDVYEEIKSSLRVNSLNILPDYTFLGEGLDNYLKIDTREGSLRYFDNGVSIAEFEILNMIDRENWGGTPSGLYEVLSKEGLRFSTTSRVYMPSSVRFYGKYLVHGEPYYPSGAPYTAPVSGGCIRVKNEKMKELYQLLEKETPILILPEKNDIFSIEEKNIKEFPEISARSYLVADMDSGKVFADNNAEKVVPIASITKIMTGLVIAEHFDTEHAIRVQEYMLTGYGETAGIYTGRVFRLIDLLPPLLIESSNNAAKVLASYFGEEDTVKRMNEKAKMIGMMNSVFTDSSGIEEGNLSTARDIYYLAYYLANSRVPFLNISKGTWTPNVNYGVFPNLQNKNFFYADPSFIGGKSGYINASKHTGFYIFNLNLGGENRRVVFIILGSETKSTTESDVRKLREWVESSFD